MLERQRVPPKGRAWMLPHLSSLWEYSGRYVAENDEGGGLCKLVICNQTRTIVGAQFLGNYSSEFLFALAAFIELELPLDDIKEIIFPHPTVCEIIKEAVCQYRHS